MRALRARRIEREGERESERPIFPILIYQQANEGSGPSQSAFLITASRRSAAPTLYVLYMILPRASIGGVLRLAAPLPVLTHWGPFGRQSVQ